MCDCGVDATSMVGPEADRPHPHPRPAVVQARDPLSVRGDAAGVLVFPWDVEVPYEMARVTSPACDISITDAYMRPKRTAGL